MAAVLGLRLVLAHPCLSTRRLFSIENGEVIWKASSEGKEIKQTTTSLRFDTVAAAGLAISKRKLWELSFKGALFLNGTPLQKKSTEVKEGDVIEVDTEEASSNEETIKRGRVVVKEIGSRTSKGGYHLILTRYKKYLLYKRKLS